MMLKFSKANAKIRHLNQSAAIRKYLVGGRKVYSFDLLSGWSCPFAKQCLSKVHIVNNRKKVVDGPHTEFRCFSASQEALLPPVYNLRKNNLNALKQLATTRDMSEAILRNLPNDAGVIRIHVGGDMFNQAYFDSWILTANACQSVLFYAYTKSLPYWVKRINDIPRNLILTASYGGRYDNLIAEYKLRYSKVVFSQYAARKLRLPIDHNDVHAAEPNRRNSSFALLLHNSQPANTEAAKAWQRIKKTAGGYSK